MAPYDVFIHTMLVFLFIFFCRMKNDLSFLHEKVFCSFLLAYLTKRKTMLYLQIPWRLEEVWYLQKVFLLCIHFFLTFFLSPSLVFFLSLTLTLASSSTFSTYFFINTLFTSYCVSFSFLFLKLIFLKYVSYFTHKTLPIRHQKDIAGREMLKLRSKRTYCFRN